MVMSVVILFVLGIPYVYFGWKILIAHLAAAIYNIGVNSHVILWGGSYNRKKIDLDKKPEPKETPKAPEPEKEEVPEVKTDETPKVEVEIPEPVEEAKVEEVKEEKSTPSEEVIAEEEKPARRRIPPAHLLSGRSLHTTVPEVWPVSEKPSL